MEFNDHHIGRRSFLSLMGGIGGMAAVGSAQTETVPTHSIPGRIQAEDFADYHDVNAGNNGGAYRQTDVDIEEGSDSDGTPTLGWIWPTEVLTYRVDVTPGTYSLKFRTASWRDEGGVIAYLGPRKLGQFRFDTSSGIYQWCTTTFEDITIEASGTETLYLQFIGGSTNFNWLEFAESNPTYGYGAGGYGVGGYGL